MCNIFNKILTPSLFCLKQNDAIKELVRINSDKNYLAGSDSEHNGLQSHCKTMTECIVGRILFCSFYCFVCTLISNYQKRDYLKNVFYVFVKIVIQCCHHSAVHCKHHCFNIHFLGSHNHSLFLCHCASAVDVNILMKCVTNELSPLASKAGNIYYLLREGVTSRMITIHFSNSSAFNKINCFTYQRVCLICDDLA